MHSACLIALHTVTRLLRPILATGDLNPVILWLVCCLNSQELTTSGCEFTQFISGRALRHSGRARPTEGPSENIRLIEDGQAQIGFVTMGVAQQGWNGMGDWTQGKQYRAMRALFPMYDTPFHFIVMQDKGARSSAELAGKRLGVGPQGGTSATF